jgi:hypothetical protein
MISKIEVERFTLSSSKPFDQVVAALNSAVGHPDIPEFWKSTHRAQSVAELQSTIEKVLGRTGLMLFASQHILHRKSSPSSEHVTAITFHLRMTHYAVDRS